MALKREVQLRRDLPTYSVSTKLTISLSLRGKSKKCDMLTSTAAVQEIRQLDGYKSVEEIRHSLASRRNSELK